VDRLTTLLRSKNIHYDEVRRVDDTHILVRNVDPAQLSQFRDIFSAQFNNVWDIAPLPVIPPATPSLYAPALSPPSRNRP